jgi:hypothetical protein
MIPGVPLSITSNASTTPLGTSRDGRSSPMRNLINEVSGVNTIDEPLVATGCWG